MCVHRTEDGKCLKYSENGVVSFCVDGPCPDDTPTNGDRIHSMTDEELAESMKQNPFLTICDIVCGGECKAIATLEKTNIQICKEIILDWLKQPAKED